MGLQDKAAFERFVADQRTDTIRHLVSAHGFSAECAAAAFAAYAARFPLPGQSESEPDLIAEDIESWYGGPKQ